MSIAHTLIIGRIIETILQIWPTSILIESLCRCSQNSRAQARRLLTLSEPLHCMISVQDGDFSSFTYIQGHERYGEVNFWIVSLFIRSVWTELTDSL
jgi:hypothetical protein